MFFLGERILAEALDLFEQLIHATFLFLLPLLLAQQLASLAALEPALEEVGLPAARRGRLILLETRVTLREIVAEQRILAAGLEQDVLLPAGAVDEQRQRQHHDLVGQERDGAQ